MVSFHNFGALLGRLSPRCSDPHQDVRLAAIDCIYTLLYIQLRYEGAFYGSQWKSSFEYVDMGKYAKSSIKLWLYLLNTLEM